MTQIRYNDFNSHLKSLFGERIQKITIDAGLTCPNRDGKLSYLGCIYCNSKGSGTGNFAKGISIKEQIIKGKELLSKKYKAKKFIAYFQSYSNTYANYEKLKEIYEEALSIDDIVGLSIGTRPDCVNESILNLLQSFTEKYLIWIEYGLQSANDDTLKFINRGHNFNCFKKAVKMTQERGIKICVHVILGLPNETKDNMLNTAKKISELKIDGIKIHLLYVIKGTKMEELFRKNEYKCLEQEEYAEIVCDFIELIPSNLIIQRLTGDPHPDELIAPLWALKKAENIALINKKLEERGSWQGKFSYAIA